MLIAQIGFMQVKEPTDFKAKDPKAIFELLEKFRSMQQEAFFVVTLNNQNAVIDTHMVALGTGNAAYITPRDIFRAALIDGATAIVVAHNHPSGTTTPSAEDIQQTKRIIEGWTDHRHQGA